MSKALGAGMRRPLLLSVTHHPEDDPEAAHAPADGVLYSALIRTPKG
jgi:hypothetical protein